MTEGNALTIESLNKYTEEKGSGEVLTREEIIRLQQTRALGGCNGRTETTETE
jgi:hypothetical protein